MTWLFTSSIIIYNKAMSTKNKFSKGKMIASIFGLTLLVAGVGAGTILVQQQQTVESLAYDPQMPAQPPSDNVGDKCTLKGANPTKYIYVSVGGCRCRQEVKCVKTGASGSKGIITKFDTCYMYGLQNNNYKICKADCGYQVGSKWALKTSKCDGIPGIK